MDYQIKVKGSIVITSVFQSTKAVDSFSKIGYLNTIIVGDNKSPSEYNNAKVTFLSVDTQAKLGYSIIKDLPYNHYCRKNIGYLFAIMQGAEVIIDADDDNMPYPDWSFPDFDGEYDQLNSDMGFINIYNLFSEQNIWPRGLPLNKINLKFKSEQLQKGMSRVGIWQGLADADPDVDAIYRLINNTPCFFKKRDPVVLGHGTVSPFNSQNTAFRKELFPLLYLPTTVNFRFTDILRGFVAQPIMWLYDYLLGFTHATVEQERNPHDYMKDFESEIPCYLHGEKIIGIISKRISSSYSIYDNLLIAYEELLNNGIVTKDEIVVVNRWISDLQKHDK
jgi:hypothetical protein